MMGECGKCGTVVLVCDIPLACGICTRVFHQRCTNLKKPAAKLIADYDGIFFKCEQCVAANNRPARDGVLDKSELKEEMEKIISGSLADVRKNIDEQVHIAVEKGIEKLIGSFNEVLRDNLVCIGNSVTSKLEDLKSSILEDLLRENKLAGMSRKRVVRHKEDCSDGKHGTKLRILTDKSDKPIPLEIDNNDSEDEVFESDGSLSYATVLSGKSKRQRKSNKNGRNQSLTDRKAGPVIVIKPIESTRTNEETRKFLKTKLDPRMHKISNFRNGRDGSIIVQCATGDNIETVKNNIEGNLGSEYSAVIPVPAKPKLKIVGMSDRYSSDEFVELLKSQNDDIKIGDVKVVWEYENPRLKYNKYNVVMEVDKDTYSCLMTARKVNIGWDRCYVYEAFNVLRCFNCGEFGHKSIECKNEETCSKCCGRHRTSECSATDFKCANCAKMNQDRKLNLDTKHPAFSVKCPVYLKLLEKKKQQALSSK